MAAALLEHKDESLNAFAVIAPSRQKHYHCIIKEANTAPYTYTPLHEIDSLEGLPPRCFFLPQAKLWTVDPLITNFTPLSYDIKALPSILSLAPHLLQATDTAIPFQYPNQGGDYVRWNAQRHRASTH